MKFNKHLMERIKINSLIISVVIGALIAWIFYIDSIRTKIYLSKKEILPATRDSVFQMKGEGRNVILGDLLRSFFRHTSNCMVAREIWTKHKILPIFLSLYSYPMRISNGEYNPFLTEREFHFLVSKAKAVRRMDIDNRNYFLVDDMNAELGVFCYKTNIVVAPLNLLKSLEN